MPDNRKKKGPQDRKRINVHETWEVHYWTQALNVTPEQLKKVVAIVGTSAAAVRKYLSEHPEISA